MEESPKADMISDSRPTVLNSVIARERIRVTRPRDHEPVVSAFQYCLHYN